MLTLRGINTYHGKIQILRNLDLYVKRGEIVSIIGPNGAGKSTLLGSILGIYPIASGSILYQDQEISRKKTERVVAKGISLVPERRQLFSSLTVKQNLYLGAYHRYPKDRITFKDDLEEVLGIFPDLVGREMDLAGTLSGGLQQMLAIGRGLMAKPRLLLLDEPSLGMAPLIVKNIFRTLHELRSLGLTVLVVEQNAKAALSVSDRVYVLEDGEVIGEDRPKNLNKEIKRAYLGYVE